MKNRLCMWKVSVRGDITYEECVAIDTWYVLDWSVRVNLMYLFKTIKAIECNKGAYQFEI